LKDTRELILDAALVVFSTKGYASAATLEIAKEAGVAEMTLFRHFQTKKNLLMESVKYGLGISLTEEEIQESYPSLSELIVHILHQKMSLISNNSPLIKMLIRETLSHTLPEDLEITRIISNQVTEKIARHIEIHSIELDPKSLSDLVVGWLLRYAIMEERPVYHLLDEHKQQKYLNQYIKILKI